MAEHGSSLRHVPLSEPEEGITKLSDAEFARIANRSAPRVTDDSPEAAKRNRARAQEELGLISELRNYRPFQWFTAMCIERNFHECRGALESPDAVTAALPYLAASFQQWRKLARWLDERELAHRRLLDAKDPMIEQLRKRLSLH